MRTDLLEVLVALAAGPLHGFGIVREVERNTGGATVLAPSLLYRRLKSLTDRGLIEVDGVYPGERGKPQRRYRLTAQGRVVLRSESRRLIELARSSRIRAAAEGRVDG